MRTKKRKLATTHVQKAGSIGIPVLCIEKGDALFLTVVDFLRLREHLSCLSKALAKMDVELKQPTHVADGHLFIPAWAREDVDTLSHGQEPIEGVDLKARILSAAVASRTTTSTSSTPALEPTGAGGSKLSCGVEATRTVGAISPRLIRKGPATLTIDGQTIPYASACPPRDPYTDRPNTSSTAWIDRVGEEVHLLDSQHHRLRAEQPDQVAGVQPGTLVAAEQCKMEKVLLAGPEAFRTQLRFDLAEGETR